jgi:hypothetical protein
MRSFFRRDNAGSFAVEADADFALGATLQIAGVANVKFQCAPDVNSRYFRQRIDDVEVNSKLERLPPGQIQPRKGLRKPFPQD